MDSILNFLGEHYIVGLLALCVIFAGVSSVIKSFMNFDYLAVEKRVKVLELIVCGVKKEDDNAGNVSEQAVSRTDKRKSDS